MKSNTTFIFAGIMSVIVGNAYATGENIVTSKSYVDNALEQKQNKIEAYNNNEYQSVLTDTTADGVVGKVQILNSDINNGEAIDGWDSWEVIPTAGAVFQVAQGKIAASAWEDGSNNTIPGVVISTDENGMVEQRMILDKTDAMTADHMAGLVLNQNYEAVLDAVHSMSVSLDDAEESVPTTAMTIAIANTAANAAANNATAALPWATAEQNATGAYNTTFANSGTNVWPTADADKVVKGTTFANAMATKQNKIAGYNSNNDEYQSLLTDTTTDGVVGKMEIMTAERNGDDPLSAWEGADDRIPTVGMVADTAQGKIPARATKIEDEDQSFAPSVVTNGTTDGDVGQMAILTAARVSGLDGEDGNEFANYTNADSLIPTAAAIRIELGYKANHMTCAGWPESVPVNQRTDANCWLWNKN